MKTIKIDGKTRPWEQSYPEGIKQHELIDDDHRLVGDVFTNAANKFPDRKAFSLVLQSGNTVEKTYAEMEQLSNAVSAYLRETLNLSPGDVIAIQLPNSIHYPAILFGAWKAGLIVTNINPLYSAREITHHIKDSGAKVLFGFAMFSDRIADVINDVELDKVIIASPWELFPALTEQQIKFFLTKVQKAVPEILFEHITFKKMVSLGKKAFKEPYNLSDIDSNLPALIQYSGGTTGESKGVILSHRNILAALNAVLTLGGATEKDSVEEGVWLVNENVQGTILTVLPLYHIFALILNLMLFTRVGGLNVLILNPRPLDNLKPAFDKYNFDWMTGVDTLYAGLMELDWFMKDPPKIDYSIGGGTAIRLDTQTRWEKTVGPLLEGYGLTETSCIVSFNATRSEGRMGTVGLPIPNIDIRIIGENGKPVSTGERGLLFVKGPNVATSYHNRPKQTAQAFAQGWVDTGDIVIMDSDGYMRIVDRAKDMILVSGFNVFPNEIESVIAELSGVGDVAVIGIKHGKRGEAPKAYIVLTDITVTKADVIEHCRKNLAAYKVPIEVEFRNELPKSPIGKIIRRELREQ